MSTHVQAFTVALTLLAGTPALTFLGLIGAALTVTLRRGGLLLSVLVLPLTIPVLIFGVAASNAAVAGPLDFGTPFTGALRAFADRLGDRTIRRSDGASPWAGMILISTINRCDPRATIVLEREQP
jgi:ABC-type transport system involved in cytochrome c biogenesis permease component